jgi:hypothetical protein
MSDLYMVASVLAGTIAFIMKFKWSVWLSFFLYFTSVINTRHDK